MIRMSCVERVLAVGLATAIIGTGLGCASSDPTRFYMLSSLSEMGPGPEVGTVEEELSLGVGPIEIPRYLDYPEILTRSDPHVVTLNDFDQWAEPLQGNVTRIVSENLATLQNTPRVFSFPWKRSAPIDYQVRIDITRFDGDPQGHAVLKAHWSILDREGEFLETRVFESRTEPRSPTVRGFVGAMSEALAALSREISGSVDEMKRSVRAHSSGHAPVPEPRSAEQHQR